MEKNREHKSHFIAVLERGKTARVTRIIKHTIEIIHHITVADKVADSSNDAIKTENYLSTIHSIHQLMR